MVGKSLGFLPQLVVALIASTLGNDGPAAKTPSEEHRILVTDWEKAYRDYHKTRARRCVRCTWFSTQFHCFGGRPSRSRRTVAARSDGKESSSPGARKRMLQPRMVHGKPFTFAIGRNVATAG